MATKQCRCQARERKWKRSTSIQTSRLNNPIAIQVSGKYKRQTSVKLMWLLKVITSMMGRTDCLNSTLLRLIYNAWIKCRLVQIQRVYRRLSSGKQSTVTKGPSSSKILLTMTSTSRSPTCHRFQMTRNETLSSYWIQIIMVHPSE